MAVSLLIAFWITDEFSFDRNLATTDRIARVEVNRHNNGGVNTAWDQPYMLGKTLRDEFGSDFLELWSFPEKRGEQDLQVWHVCGASVSAHVLRPNGERW